MHRARVTLRVLLLKYIICGARAGSCWKWQIRFSFRVYVPCIIYTIAYYYIRTTTTTFQRRSSFCRRLDAGRDVSISHSSRAIYIYVYIMLSPTRVFDIAYITRHGCDISSSKNCVTVTRVLWSIFIATLYLFVAREQQPK